MSQLLPSQQRSPGEPSTAHRLRSVRKRNRKPKNNNDIEIPSKFGNAADYWKHFDEVAGAQNRQLVDNINQNLDLLIVFGGLFAGVNSGFLAFAVPMLSPDSAEETNHLLRLLVTGGANQTGITEDQLTPPGPSPSDQATAILFARLFSVSLTLTLLAAFGAMIGKQWMIYYTRGSQGGPSEAESRELQRKLAGVDRCGLRFLVELALPGLLQIALFVFSVGVIKYLSTLDAKVSWINEVLALIGVAAFGITVIHAVVDQYCPFQTSISQFLWFTISLPFDIIPGAFLVITKRFPKKLIKKATGGLFKSFKQGWRHPLRMAKTETRILTNTIDSSYIRTLTHRLKFDPFSRVVSRIRRQDDPTEILDARHTCYMLKHTRDPDILRAVSQSIPTLFEKKAMSVLLKDKAVVRLHRLFRDSIAQAEDSPDALAQDSDDKSDPAVNAVIYGRAIVHLFIALGPHDDWFWDDYETALNHGWLEPWELVGADERPEVMIELEHQRRIIQASLTIGPDRDPPSVEIEESALPLYIAANIKALLHRRMYYHLSHYPPKFRPTVQNWNGETDLERIAFCSVFPDHYPRTIGLVAWALATVPFRQYDRAAPILEKYDLFWNDVDGLWAAYSGVSSILLNVAKAIHAYPLRDAENSRTGEYKLPLSDVKKTYKAMLEATTAYIEESATKDDFIGTGHGLVDSVGSLKTRMNGSGSLDNDDNNIKALLQPLVDAVVSRCDQQQRLQHARSMSGSNDDDPVLPPLAREWFEGTIPYTLEECKGWRASSTSDPAPKTPMSFLSRWRRELPADRVVLGPLIYGTEEPSMDGEDKIMHSL